MEFDLKKTDKKINLGCGQDYKEGFINIDFHDHVKVEMVHNLNQIPYPFDDNSVDFIYASHILEHLDDPFTIMKELHRILKVNGKIQIKFLILVEDLHIQSIKLVLMLHSHIISIPILLNQDIMELNLS